MCGSQPVPWSKMRQGEDRRVAARKEVAPRGGAPRSSEPSLWKGTPAQAKCPTGNAGVSWGRVAGAPLGVPQSDPAIDDVRRAGDVPCTRRGACSSALSGHHGLGGIAVSARQGVEVMPSRPCSGVALCSQAQAGRSPLVRRGRSGRSAHGGSAGREQSMLKRSVTTSPAAAPAEHRRILSPDQSRPHTWKVTSPLRGGKELSCGRRRPISACGGRCGGG